MAASGTSNSSDTAERMLDVAERLVQTRGFNGFSYADIAAELSITKASLHYHFASKSSLGETLIARYTARFEQALAAIDRDIADPRRKLDAYVDIYAAVLARGRVCLCGMLAGEYETLPPPMSDAVARFFAANERWLTGVLTDGQSDGSLSPTPTPRDAAQMIVAALEGAMMVARIDGGPERFESSARNLLRSVTSAPERNV